MRVVALVLLGGVAGCFAEPSPVDPTVGTTGSSAATSESSEDEGSDSGVMSGPHTTTGDGTTTGVDGTSSTGGGIPPESISLFDRACVADTFWVAYSETGQVGPVSCGSPEESPTIVRHSRVMIGGETYVDTIEAAMPLVAGGEIDGEFFGLNLDAFEQPVLRGAVACHDVACMLDWTVEVYPSADPTPATFEFGTVTNVSGVVPFEIDLTPHYAGASQFSILLFAAVGPGAVAEATSRVYWIDLAIEDAAM